MACALVFPALLLLGATAAFAQRVQIQSTQGPLYVGEAVDIHVVADGFEEEPTPEISSPEMPSARGVLQFIGVTPKVSSSISIINGQMTRSHEVTFAYRFRYLARQAGPVRIEPFTLTQGGVSLATSALNLQIREVPTSDIVDVSVGVPKGPLFVGQKVPIAVEIWVDREAWSDLISYALVVPLMTAPDVRFIDNPGAPRDTDLQIQTDEGTLLLPAHTSERQRDGRNFVVVRTERTMVPLSAAVLKADAATFVINQGTQFRRDMFRQRQATSVRKLLARGQDISLEVAEVPLEGRPPSFAGAIGRGFTLDVSADRSVVQLGEPIALNFTLRGDGDLSTAGLPALDAEGLLDPGVFRLPEDRATGVIEQNGGKRFDVNVRVLDSAVREIPALAYSWFDTDSRTFQTTHSRPIALSVAAAEVIGAGQVERRAGSDEEETKSADARSADASGEPARAGSLTLTGANLAAERDPAVLLRDERAGGVNAVLAGGLYGLGLAFVGLALFDRKRRDVDPAVAALDRALAKARRELDAALSLPSSEGAERASRALRQMLSLSPSAASAELDTLLGELDARSYAPPSLDREPLPSSICERAKSIASSIAGLNS